jgi:hypothetical protein
MRNIQILLSAFFLFCTIFCSGQGIQRPFAFQKGDQYKKRIYLTSTFVMQRGTKALTVTSSSSVYKTYKVTDVSIEGYSFNINTDKMDVVINSERQKLNFDSKKGIEDTTSKIENALNFMVGKSNNITVNIYGKIIAGDDFSDMQLVNDSLLTFAGIQPESFKNGTQFNIIPQFVLRNYMQKGYVWTDTATYNQQKMKTNFWIDQITPTSTIVKFKSSVIGDLVNSNSTGTYIIDKESGVLIQKLIESISTGYQISNNKVYSTTRRISLSEDCTKEK